MSFFTNHVNWLTVRGYDLTMATADILVRNRMANFIILQLLYMLNVLARISNKNKIMVLKIARSLNETVKLKSASKH